MRTINRRTLAHETARVLDAVLDTGEPVEVVGRDGRAVVILPRPQSALERWEAQGLIEHATLSVDEFDRIGAVDTDLTAEEILDDLRGES